MNNDNVIDFARYRALVRGERSREETDAWAADIEHRAETLYNKTLRDPFTGVYIVAFDDVKNRHVVLIAYHLESRVQAKYNIGDDNSLRRAKPTKKDDLLLQRYRSGVFHPKTLTN